MNGATDINRAMPAALSGLDALLCADNGKE